MSYPPVALTLTGATGLFRRSDKRSASDIPPVALTLTGATGLYL